MILTSFYSHITYLSNNELDSRWVVLIEEGALDVLTFLWQKGFMNSRQLDLINNQMLQLLSDIRPNAVALVDAFDISDHNLGSVLGRYDGQVYENLYRWAQQSPLNETQVRTVMFLVYWCLLNSSISL